MNDRALLITIKKAASKGGFFYYLNNKFHVRHFFMLVRD